MKIGYLFFDTHMSASHKTLRARIKKDLLENECAIFVNKKWSAVKMLTSANTILYHRRPNNERLEPETIKFLPNCVNGSNLDYDAALKSAILSKYKKVYPDAKARKSAETR